MRLIKGILFLFIIPTMVLAKDIKIEQLSHEYNIKYWLNDYSYSVNKKATIDNSFSILHKGCVIEFNNTKKAVLMQNKSKDIEFTFLHEIAHCVLSNEVFYNKIDWKINISAKEKENIEKIIKDNEVFYLNNKKTPLIKVIYHEIFADTFASMLYIRKNKNSEKDIRYLLQKRIQQSKNPYDSHLSVAALQSVLKEKQQIKELTIDKLKDKAIKITQEKLLDYIRAEYE